MLDIDISYDIENKEGIYEEYIVDLVTHIIKSEKKEEFDKKDYYVSILITTNEVTYKELIKSIEEKIMPTDVISFAYNETENFGPIEVIGSIVISIDRVKQQARNTIIVSKRILLCFNPWNFTYIRL